MNYKNIIVANERGITTITLNRPEKLNALDANILQELIKAIDEAREDDESKVMIITGAGRGFCSGADITSTALGTDTRLPGINRSHRLEPFILFGAVMKRLRNFHKPILVAINGMASGGGLSLACLGDIRIGCEEARFSAIFVKRGLVPDCGASYLLPRIVGTQNALKLMWTGDIIDAREAERIGLLSGVVPADELMSTVKELALQIAHGPSTAIELMKRMVYEGLEANSFSLSMAYEGWAQEMCYLTEDVQEGIKSFMERRPSNFTGK
ncbi:MAG: enoyl-CoA hydratase/isomerase family protein [Deltaproteobacteria bacterium]|nr:enoyl-CoA hydratase/isomerase family protein [Deltaproteobacteria bacterium]